MTRPLSNGRSFERASMTIQTRFMSGHWRLLWTETRRAATATLKRKFDGSKRNVERCAEKDAMSAKLAPKSSKSNGRGTDLHRLMVKSLSKDEATRFWKSRKTGEVGCRSWQSKVTMFLMASPGRSRSAAPSPAIIKAMMATLT